MSVRVVLVGRCYIINYLPNRNRTQNKTRRPFSTRTPPPQFLLYASTDVVDKGPSSHSHTRPHPTLIITFLRRQPMPPSASIAIDCPQGTFIQLTYPTWRWHSRYPQVPPPPPQSASPLRRRSLSTTSPPPPSPLSPVPCPLYPTHTRHFAQTAVVKLSPRKHTPQIKGLCGPLLSITSEDF